MGRIGPRTNRGHQWANSHDNERGGVCLVHVFSAV